jgi:hypothetical protein
MSFFPGTHFCGKKRLRQDPRPLRARKQQKQILKMDARRTAWLAKSLANEGRIPECKIPVHWKTHKKLYIDIGSQEKLYSDLETHGIPCHVMASHGIQHTSSNIPHPTFIIQLSNIIFKRFQVGRYI